MDLFRCVVLTISFTETIGTGFFISDDASDWTTTSKQCQLAEPGLIFSPDGKAFVNISMDIDENVWVGYYQARTAFEYFGCAKHGNNTPMLNTRKEDPGQCMSACGAKKRIGVFKKQCFCFENEIENDVGTMFPHCNRECRNIKGIVCGGGQAGTKYISLYRSIGMDNIGILVNEENDDKINCTYYDQSTFKWNNCSVFYKTICGIGNNSWIENKTISEPFFGNWTQSTIKCFENNTRPSTYNNTQSLNTVASTPPLWTGIVRSQVVYKYTTDSSHWEHANKYGYLLRKDDDSIALKLTGNTHSKKRRLCINVTDTTAIPSSTETLSSTGSSDVGAIVGATLSIVAVIVVVVVVFLFLRKRGFQLPFLKKENQAPSASMIQNNNAYAISRPVGILQSTYHTDNEEYAEIDLTTTIDNEARKGVINDASDSSDYAHDYFVLEKPEEEQYDSTKPGDQKSDPYNKLSFEKSSNYDHVGAGNAEAGNAGRKVSDSENTYNTISLGNSYLKTSGGESNNAYSMAEDTEDTYNHTTVPMHQMGQKTSENDYGAK